MKKIYICYNSLTLYKAISLIRSNNEKNSIILLRQNNDTLLLNQFNEFKIKIIKYNGKSKVYKVKAIIDSLMHFIKYKNYHEIIVFKDNEPLEKLIIKFFKSRNPEGKVTLIEEGLGIYESKEYTYGKASFKLKSYPQGYNPSVNEVVCSNPVLFNKIKGRKYLSVIQEENVYSDKSINYFLDKILNYNLDTLKKIKNYHILFLTQPLNEIDIDENITYSKVFKSMTTYSTIIKRHPRDKVLLDIPKNADFFELDKTISILPLEIIYNYLKTPVIITYYSSAYKEIININKSIKVILLYKLLNNNRINKIMKPIEKEMSANLLIPKSFEEFLEILVTI